MDFGATFPFFGTSLQVCLIDLLLSGDNALVIALACRSLAPEYLRKAVLYGTAAAILLRLFLTTVVGFLLAVPGLKLVGAVALIVIAIKLIVAEDEDPEDQAAPGSRGDGLLGAISVIFIADLVMSLDNVVALSAVAQGSIAVLALGLLFSVPLLMYGSTLVTTLLHRYPVLIPCGGALLGWLAGDIGVSDPLIADWVNSEAPALTVAMPLLGALFVILESRIVEQELGVDRSKAPRPVVRRPLPTPPSVPAPPKPQPSDDSLPSFFSRHPLWIIATVALLGWAVGDVLIANQNVAGWLYSGAQLFGITLVIISVGTLIYFWRAAKDDESEPVAVAPSDPAPAPAPAPASSASLFGALARLATRKLTAPPATPAVVFHQHRPPSIQEAAAAGTLILVAEDNLSDRRAVTQALEWLGYAVEAVADGQEALERLAELPCGLLLTDCYMPRLDAFKLTTRIRKAERDSGRRLPIVAMVGHYTGDGLGQRYLDAGMDDCLSKPPALNQLDEMVARWLPGAAALRRPLVQENATANGDA